MAEWLVCVTLNLKVTGANLRLCRIFLIRGLFILFLIELYKAAFFMFSLVFREKIIRNIARLMFHTSFSLNLISFLDLY